MKKLYKKITMPLEIRELIIRASVVDRGNNPSHEMPGGLQKLKKEIMQECLHKLRKKEDRKIKR